MCGDRKTRRPVSTGGGGGRGPNPRAGTYPGGGPPGPTSGVDRFGALSSSLSLVSKLRIVSVHQQTPTGLFLIWPSRTIAPRWSVIIHTRRVTPHRRRGPPRPQRKTPLALFHDKPDDLRFLPDRQSHVPGRTDPTEAGHSPLTSPERTMRPSWHTHSATPQVTHFARVRGPTDPYRSVTEKIPPGAHAKSPFGPDTEPRRAFFPPIRQTLQ